MEPVSHNEVDMETIIASLVVSLAALTIFRLNSVTPFIRITFSSDDYLNSHLKYQLALLVLAITVLAVTYAQNPINLRILFSVGNISAPANPVECSGLAQGQIVHGYLPAYISAL